MPNYESGSNSAPAQHESKAHHGIPRGVATVLRIALEAAVVTTAIVAATASIVTSR